MESMHYLFYGWIFCTIAAYQSDESISFSPMKLNSVSKSSSYWYGNITIPTDSSILEEEIKINLYVNSFQGLLFYTIDSKYHTLWVEFTKDTLKLSFYNFKIREPDSRIFKLQTLCTRITDNKVYLKFSIRNEEINIHCNGNTLKTVYVRPFDSLSQNDIQSFLAGMTLPIPDFGNATVFDEQTNLVHMWIGNTPSSDNVDSFRNTGELVSNENNLWGCIKSFSVRKTLVKLATTGNFYGDMVTPFCKPLCKQNPCTNNAQCFELWRERFRCDCGYSEFIGELCNEDYSLKFHNDMTLEESIDFKFKRLQFSFKPHMQFVSTGNKLLSLKFLSNKFLYIYTDINDYLQARFEVENGVIYDVRFVLKITNNKIYTFFIESDIDGINFKIADSSARYIIDQKSIPLNQVNLIIQHILVGDSHAISMQWIKKFNGCISNLVLDSGRTKYTWNKFANFNKMPKCKEIETIELKSTEQPTVGRHPDNYTLFGKKPLITMDKTSGQVNTSHATYIIIVVVLSALVVSIIVIVVFKLKSNSRKSLDSKKENLIMHEAQKPPEIIYTTYTSNFYNSANGSPMTYKPPYKARSMSFSSNGKSITSLPTANTPTLVTPEDNEMLL